MAPVVSVLLPYRDAAATLEEALASVLDQRGVAFEVVAVDDGSRDEGPALVRRAAARDPRVVPVAAGGRGIAGALGAGLAAARGRYVARMDGDDVALPDRLARQVEALERAPSLGAVGSLVEPFPAEAVGEGTRAYVAWLNALVTPEDHARDLFVESPLCHPSVTLRRAALDAVGPWRDFDGPEDYDLWLRLAAAGHGLAKVPRVLLRWRHHAGRATVRDPRYARERFLATKAPHLAARLRALGRPVAVCGAGPTGRRVARALEPWGVRAALFADVGPDRIGRVARGVPVVGYDALALGAHTVVVAVGARGARDRIRAWLAARGWRDGEDFVCAA